MTPLTPATGSPAAPPRTQVLGILNVTPDSFSDGGQWTGVDAAVDHASRLVAEGATIIDVGGESTRPGATRVSENDEHQRVLPVVEALVGRGIRVSVDTMRASTARAAVGAGAEFINDVSGGLADPEMYRTIAATGVNYIVMHWRGHSDTMQGNTDYTDVVSEVYNALEVRLAEAIIWGVDPAKLLVDPGLGFSKTAAHNWALLRQLPRLVQLGFPVVVGASRKGFLTPFAAEGAPASDRDDATATISALSAQSGAWGVRVHNVAATQRSLDVWHHWNGAAS